MEAAKNGVKNNLKAFIYEFIGTALIMYAFMVEKASYPLATTFGLSLVCWNISGGHFNPAITLSVYISKMEWGKNLIPTSGMIVCQWLGGFFGVLLGYLALIDVAYQKDHTATEDDVKANVPVTFLNRIGPIKAVL